MQRNIWETQPIFFWEFLQLGLQAWIKSDNSLNILVIMKDIIFGNFIIGLLNHCCIGYTKILKFELILKSLFLFFQFFHRPVIIFNQCPYFGHLTEDILLILTLLRNEAFIFLNCPNSFLFVSNSLKPWLPCLVNLHIQNLQLLSVGLL